jgi:hypothetical protein
MNSRLAFPLGASILALAAPAAAQPDTMAGEIVEATPRVQEDAFQAAPVEDATLQSVAGKADLSLVAETESTATVTDNSVGDNSTTGEIRVNDNAFQNLSGLSLLNINTGNNVAINSAMNVNIAINPPQP